MVGVTLQDAQSGYTWNVIQPPHDEAFGLTHESVMPGGYTVASFNLPWSRGLTLQELTGCKFIVCDGVDPVWYGRVYNVVDTIRRGERVLAISARGPWERAARRQFSQSYPAGTGGWAAEDILKAAWIGNVEDVLFETTDWTDPNVDLSAIAWSQSTPQTVVGDTLRFGDSSVAPWAFITTPPVMRPSRQGAFTFSTNSGSGFTGTTVAGSGTAASQEGLYVRGGYSLQCYANDTTGTASAYHTLAAPLDDFWMHAWVQLRKESAAAEHDYMIMQTAAPARIVRLSSGATDLLYVYNEHTTTQTNTAVTLSRGCWHHLALRVVRHATNGIIEVWLDDKRILNSVSLDTGDTSIGRVNWGMMRTAAGNRWINFDNCIANTSQVLMVDTNLDTETLPVARIIKLDTLDYDLVISQQDIKEGYALDRSMQNAANQVDMRYSTASDLAMLIDTDSVARHGQIETQLTASKIASATVAGYLQARWLDQYKDAVAMLQPMTLTRAPQSKWGARWPLARLRAGMRFRLRELPELGNMYIGATRYSAGDAGQGETCQVTPYGLIADVSMAIAGKQGRAWT